MNQSEQDLVIIGGGIMGLMTAYYASAFVKNVTIIEKNTIGADNKEAASFSFTRSIRTDYLEPFYARLALEARQLWLEIERQSNAKLFIKCGCLNIAKESITPDLALTYAERSYRNIAALNYRPIKFTREELQERYPQIDADVGTLDSRGGFLSLQAITRFLLERLRKNNVTLLENTEITCIEEKDNRVLVQMGDGETLTKKLVITAGKGTNQLIRRVQGNKLQFPITYDRPQRKYYFPPANLIEKFLPEKLPVTAYTDVGIYVHPIFDKSKGAVKVAYFVPVGVKKDSQIIKCVEDFVAACMPILKDVPSEEITDSEFCWYDTVVDDDFILGSLPNFQNIFVGTGFRGTGYKFGPIVGKVLSQLALQNGTVYNINQFSPGRFTT